MARLNQSLCFVSLTLGFLLCFVVCSGSVSPGEQPPAKLWCVANPFAPTSKIEEKLKLCCQLKEIDCSVIEAGGSCFLPNTTLNHASVAFNLYFKAEGMRNTTCTEYGLGLLAITDPSYGTCKYK